MCKLHLSDPAAAVSTYLACSVGQVVCSDAGAPAAVRIATKLS
jgi:hypothetical protein